MSLLDVGTGGNSLLVKIAFYVLAAIVLMGIGAAGGYKAGVVFQTSADQKEIKDLNAKITALQLKVNTQVVADVTSAKGGQDAMTDTLSNTKVQGDTSATARDKILNEALKPQPQVVGGDPKSKPPVKIPVKPSTVPGTSSPPASEEPMQSPDPSTGLACGLSVINAQIVNQLLEASDETHFFVPRS